MCGIFGSFDKNKFEELREMNLYRGNFTHSLARVKLDGSLPTSLIKGTKKPEIPDLEEYDFYIGHCQAPTSRDGKNPDNAHPAVYENSYLWHNGIIKDQCIKEMQELLNSAVAWDTLLLNKYITKDYDLSNIDGSFACVWIKDNKLHLFRNLISPLYIDENLNFSSVKFEGSKPLKAECIFVVQENKLIQTDLTFSTKNNPYFLP